MLFETYLVAVELLEQVNGLLEVIDDLLLRGVVIVAVWLDGVDAGSWQQPSQCLYSTY